MVATCKVLVTVRMSCCQVSPCKEYIDSNLCDTLGYE
jgi:hypothetical protein